MPGEIKKAVALAYDSETSLSPKIVASGSGYIADKILQIAKENNIPIMTNMDATNILFQMKIDMEIPESLYQVIAQIYAFILKTDQQYAEKQKSL